MPRRPAPLAGGLAVVLVAVLLAALLAGCRPGGVLVTFRPETGARYSYRIEVSSTSVVDIAGQPPEREDDHVVLRADHEVLARGRRGTRVEVRLQGGGGAPRTFVVTLDRSARLSGIERVETVPAEALGDLGLAEIFPAAAGAAPHRRLRPGERWDIDEDVPLPGGAAGRLRGSGRVAELRVVDGIDAAVVTTDVTLFVSPRTGESARTQGYRVDRAELETTTRSVHAIGDGAVIESRSVTEGDLTVAIASPDERRDPVTARLTVGVTSTTALVSRRDAGSGGDALGQFGADVYDDVGLAQVGHRWRVGHRLGAAIR